MSKEIKAKDGDLSEKNKRIKEILAVTRKDWRVKDGAVERDYM